VIGPLTLNQQLAAWRRRGCQCRLDDRGRLRSRGLKKLSVAEREALFASAPMVRDLLLKRRTKKDEEQQHRMASPPERPRRVIGQHVVPGYPSLSRLLYADEVKDITPSPRARQLQGVTYGWLVGGE
jgi:hypothetical protein